MGEDKSGKKETRPVLGEITNQKLGKRWFSSISSSPTSASKSGIGNKRIADSKSEDDDSHFWKQVSKVAESLEKERYGSAKCPKVGNESGLSPLSGGKVYRLRTSSGSGSVHAKTQTVLPNAARDLCKSPKLPNVVTLAGTVKESMPSIKAAESCSKLSERKHLDGGKDCRGEETVVVSDSGENVLADAIEESIPRATVAESTKLSERNYVEGAKECQGEQTVVISDSGENDCIQESLATKAVRDDSQNLDAGCLPSSRCESVVSSRLREFGNRDSHGLKRCTVQKGDGCSSSAADLDLLKSCSCSFCTKASYIWSDLHYQDVKGRISVLTKSQKEASNLAQRYYGENEKVRHGQGQFMRDANLENDLTSQWKSLFLHMENIFASENSQLQADLLALKDLREDFRINPDSINDLSSDAQQCSSDASDHSIV